MMDDIIGEAYDAAGNRVAITVKECYKNYMNVVKLLYHDYMIRVADGDFKSFRKMQVETTKKVVDLVHARYADHVEGQRREFMEKIRLEDIKDDSGS